MRYQKTLLHHSLLFLSFFLNRFLGFVHCLFGIRFAGFGSGSIGLALLWLRRR